MAFPVFSFCLTPHSCLRNDMIFSTVAHFSFSDQGVKPGVCCMPERNNKRLLNVLSKFLFLVI